MTVVVRNETAKPWVFEGSGGQRQIAAGSVELISDDEWGSVISAKRGSGALNPLSNDPHSQSKVNFDYLLVGATYEVLYLGFAVQSAADSDPVWTIKKLAYQTLGSENKVTQMQVLDAVAWTVRAGLPWT